jgi:hypothetical protein
LRNSGVSSPKKGSLGERINEGRIRCRIRRKTGKTPQTKMTLHKAIGNDKMRGRGREYDITATGEKMPFQNEL